MSNLPKNWQWLENEGSPKILVEALKLYGTTEKAGNANNPVIMSWAKEIGATDYTSDSIPWCGLLMGVVVKRAGYNPVKDPLWAKNWSKFYIKKKDTDAELGDILTFVRPEGGHVAIYVGEDKNYFYVLGGNQSDAVNITKIYKSRLFSVNSPNWINKPSNVRKIYISDNGMPISTNEA